MLGMSLLGWLRRHDLLLGSHLLGLLWSYDLLLSYYLLLQGANPVSVKVTLRGKKYDVKDATKELLDLKTR